MKVSAASAETRGRSLLFFFVLFFWDSEWTCWEHPEQKPSGDDLSAPQWVRVKDATEITNGLDRLGRERPGARRRGCG